MNNLWLTEYCDFAVGRPEDPTTERWGAGGGSDRRGAQSGRAGEVAAACLPPCTDIVCACEWVMRSVWLAAVSVASSSDYVSAVTSVQPTALF